MSTPPLSKDQFLQESFASKAVAVYRFVVVVISAADADVANSVISYFALFHVHYPPRASKVSVVMTDGLTSAFHCVSASPNLLNDAPDTS